jgi:predicted membrane protein
VQRDSATEGGGRGQLHAYSETLCVRHNLFIWWRVCIQTVTSWNIGTKNVLYEGIHIKILSLITEDTIDTLKQKKILLI